MPGTEKEKLLIIGLGNPGEEYVSTYHNAGREALDFIHRNKTNESGLSLVQDGKDFRFARIENAILIWPDTFMNLSGKAFESALRWFDVKPENTVVLHDDSDLAIGEHRNGGGGAAGHHGIESILEKLGSGSLRRIRIGVREPMEKTGEKPRRKAGDFVLKKISPEDKEKLQVVFKEIMEELFQG